MKNLMLGAVLTFFAMLGSIQVAAFELSEGAIGIDLRTSAELWVNPSVNSTHIPISDLEDSISKKVISKDAPIYLFCQSGGRSAKGNTILKELGYTNVIDVKTWKNWNELNSTDASQ